MTSRQTLVAFALCAVSASGHATSQLNVDVASAAVAERAREAYRIPAPDPEKELPRAVAAAKHDGRPVLLDLGAAWCVDCRVLWRHFENPLVARVLTDNFHLVEIDIGESLGPNNPWSQWVDPVKTGIPSIVLLDGRGTLIPGTMSSRWRTAHEFSAQTVKTYLEELARIGRAHMEKSMFRP